MEAFGRASAGLPQKFWTPFKTDICPLKHHIFFLWWNHKFSSFFFSIWEAILGKEIPYCSVCRHENVSFQWKIIFLHEEITALVPCSFELISWLKNITTEKHKWVFLGLFEKYVPLKYVLILKCTSTAAFKKWIERHQNDFTGLQNRSHLQNISIYLIS